MASKRKFNFKFYLNTRRKLFYAIALAFLSFSLLLFLIIPQVNLLVTQLHELKREDSKLTRLRQKAVGLDNLKTSLTMKKLKILDKVLPSKKPLLELLTQLNNLSKINQVKIDVLQVSPGVISSVNTKVKNQSHKSVKDYDSLVLKMNISGSFEHLQKFMLLLEKIAPFTTVNSFSLNKKSSFEMAQNDQVSAVLSSKTYFFLNQNQTAKGMVAKLTAQDKTLLNELADFKPLNRPIDLGNSGGLEDLFGVKSWQNVKESDINHYLQSQPQSSP